MNRILRPDQPESCPELDRLARSRIDDAVEELRGWHWPTEEEIKRRENWSESDDVPSRSDLADAPNENPFVDEADYEHGYEPATTIRHDALRVGRNDPCPCGSGKKYKKCCLRKAADE